MAFGVLSWQWIAIGVCLVASAFFSASETALTALGEARTSALIDAGGGGTLLRVWKYHPDRVLTTLLLGNTLANIALGALSAAIALELGFDHGAVLATVITTLVVLAFGEVLPKTFAKRFSTATALLFMPLVALLYWTLLPLTVPLTWLPRGLSHALKLQEAPAPDPLAAGELEYLIAEGGRRGSIDEVRQELLTSVLDFTETLVKEIMVPRTRVVALAEDATADEVLRLVTESELSRIPVFRETMDEIAGVLYVKQLLTVIKAGVPKPFVLSKYVRPAFFVPEGMKVSRLLTEMQRRKTHLAVVVDEFGGTSGIVTMEDVVEQIVGDIHDESDIDEKQIKALGDGVILADGQVSMRDLEADLGVDFPDDRDYESLGGFVTSTAGRVPPAGSLVLWGDLTFTVKAADERRVLKVEIAKKRPPHDKAAGEGQAAGPATKPPPREKV